MAHILIVGSGVVGQATGRGFARKGHAITYVDINPQTIMALRARGLRAMRAEEVAWETVDVVMLAVSTPTQGDRVVLSHLEAAAHDVGRGLARASRRPIVVVRSTVPPTTTQERITPILEYASGGRAGVDFGVAMNPEFLRQVSSEQDFLRPWITVLGASDRETAEQLDELYAPFGALIVRCTPTEAETIKYVNNIYNALKISYFNEVHQICQQLGIDSNLVGTAVARSAESMWNPLYGTRGGVPYGGACLPKDTVAFLAFVRERGWEHLMLEATVEVNARLSRQTPAAASPAEIEDVLEAAQDSLEVAVGAGRPLRVAA